MTCNASKAQITGLRDSCWMLPAGAWLVLLVLALEPAFAQTPAARSRPAERSGAEIVKAQCAKCHQSGVSGAPRIGNRDDWIPRMKQGLDAVVRSAISGHGAMPARGGMANLTDTEMKNAVVYMFNPSKPAAK